jgi:hypothetical protein
VGCVTGEQETLTTWWGSLIYSLRRRRFDRRAWKGAGATRSSHRLLTMLRQGLELLIADHHSRLYMNDATKPNDSPDHGSTDQKS